MSDTMDKPNPLPLECYSANEAAIVIIKRGLSGYYSTSQGWPNPHGMPLDELADLLNAKQGVTRMQRLAMEAGSMFGWNAPGADPARYNRQMNH